MNLLLHKKQRMLLKQNDANPYEVGHVLGNLQQTLVDISANPLWHLPGIRLEQHLINWCKGCLGFVTLGGEGTLYIAGITVWNCHFYMEPQAFIRLNKMFFDTLSTWKSAFSTLFRTINVEDSNPFRSTLPKNIYYCFKRFLSPPWTCGTIFWENDPIWLVSRVAKVYLFAAPRWRMLPKQRFWQCRKRPRGLRRRGWPPLQQVEDGHVRMDGRCDVQIKISFAKSVGIKSLQYI